MPGRRQSGCPFSVNTCKSALSAVALLMQSQVRQVGAVFALYCLYQTQPSRERVYLPLPALQLLTALVPRLRTEGLHGALTVAR